jgi:hypothetical protein
MANNEDTDRAWRRFDDDKDLSDRPGSLERRWGYGNRMAPDGGRQGGNRQNGRQQNGKQSGGNRRPEREYQDNYNAPRYWASQEEWNQPGPFTGKGPRGYRRPDESILEEVCGRLAQHAQIDASEIEVKVENGEVTLTGAVQDRRMKRLAERNIEAVTGVVDVHNRLRLRDHTPSEDDLSQQEKLDQMDNPFPGGPTPTGPAS